MFLCIILLLVLTTGLLVWSLCRGAQKIPAAQQNLPSPTPSEVQVLVLRSYINCPERPGAATEPQAEESSPASVTFAEAEVAATSKGTMPVWDQLSCGPVCVLGPETEDGRPCEYETTPPPLREKKSPEKAMDQVGIVMEEFADEDPAVTDITDEERQAIAGLDVQAFL